MSDEILKSFLDERRLERLERISGMRTASLTVVLDRIHNSHNISAVLRSAEAFGLRDVHIVGSLDINDGIALGTEDWLRIHRHSSAAEVRRTLAEESCKIVVTAPEDQRSRASGAAVSLPVYSLPFEERLALVFGNEKEGVSPELFDAASYHAFIPMFGFVESLNVSVACAICLFASTVRITGSERRMPLLDDAGRKELMSDWLRRNFGNAELLDRELERRRNEKS